MPNVVDITVRSTDETKPVMDEVERRYSESGKRAADNFTRDANGRLHDNLGKFVAEGEELGDGAGKGAGKKFSAGFSPLIMSAFAGAATLGPVALVAGAGVAVAGIAALVARSNAGIASEYQALGQNVSSTLTEAVAPFAGDVEKSIGILDQGLSTAGPELKNVFAAAAPYSEDIAKSLVSIVNQALPGFSAGLREIQPIMQILDTVTGDIGKGIGGFARELGTGSSGAAVGLQALGDALGHILPDVGQILGALSNGLGPALKDILTVATPVAGALAGIVSAFPPKVIEAAAVATAALFAAFKLGALTGIVAEGASFVSFLTGTAIAEGAATTATEALGAAMDALPLVAVVAGVAGLAAAAEHLGGTGDHTALNIDQMTSSLLDAANGSAAAQDQVNKMAEALSFMGNVTGGGAVQGMKDLDTSLTTLMQNDPAAAAKEFDQLSKAMEANGTSANDVAKYLPNYTKAVQDAQLQQKIAADTATRQAQATDTLTTALQTAAGAAGTSAQQSAVSTLAAVGLTNGQDGLTTSLYNALQAYSGATGAASGYNSILQALNGNTASLDDAQNSMAQQLLTLKSSFKANGDTMDLNTQAGINNRQALSSAAKAAVSLATAQYQANGDMGAANKTLKQQEQNILNNTGATGKARAALQAYLDQILKIPENVTTNVGANTSVAYGQVERFIAATNASSAYVQVYASNGGVGGRQLLAHGGAVGASHAMEGGPRGNTVTVGEHGIEDVDLPVGSTVHSHEDTMSRRGDSGGTVKVELYWAGGSSDDWLFKAIRGGIRARAGADPNSVQKVLGGNF